MFHAENNSKGTFTVSDSKRYPVVIIEKDINGKRLLRSRPNNHISVDGNIGPALSPIVLLSDWRECRRKGKCEKPTAANGESRQKPNDRGDHCSDQVNFLNLLNLTPRLPAPPATAVASPATVVSNHMSDPEVEINKYGKIDKNKLLQFCLTSDLGQKLIDKHLITNHLESVLKYEKYCFTSKRRLVNGDTAVRDVPLYDYDVTFIPRRDISIHKYCFTSAHRSERMRTINTGLNKRGRTLRAQCKPLKIVLKRLRSKEIERWTCSEKKNTAREVISVLDSGDDIAVIAATSQTINGFPGKSKQPLVETNKMPNKCLSKYLRSPPRNGSPPRKTYDQVRQPSIDVKERCCLSRNGFQPCDKLPAETKDSDSDSDVQFICCKGPSLAKPRQSANKAAELTIAEVKDYTASNRFNVHSLTNGKLLNFVSSAIFKCRICHYQTPSEKYSVLERLQDHMKQVHREWKEVMALHKVELDHQHGNHVMVVEAYATDHLLI